MRNLGKENEFVEFKKSTSEVAEGAISISAMLNKNGKGKLYFGVKNNGDAIGQQISENTLRDISRKIASDIRPAIYPSIREIEGTPGVIEVEFFGFDRPYSCQGRFYVRSSDEDRQLDIHELLKLINHGDASNSVWEKTETDEDFDDVDEAMLKSYFLRANACGRIAEPYLTKEEALKKLSLTFGTHLNNAGRVLFSKNRPLALKLAVFKTDEKLSFIDVQRYEGNLFDLAKKGQEYIMQHINYAAEIVGGKRIERSEIPERAIREAVMNSLCHSNFDESMNNEIYITPTKVVVFNPGSFPSGYEPRDFAYSGAESILRNPLIARALYYSGDIDSWATGFRRIYDECGKSGVEVSYKMKDNGFELTFYRGENDNRLETKIIQSMGEDSSQTLEEIAKSLNTSRRTIQTYVNKMRADGKIERIGSNKTGHWRIK